MKDNKKKSKTTEIKVKQPDIGKSKPGGDKPKGLTNLPDDFDIKKVMGCGG